MTREKVKQLRPKLEAVLREAFGDDLTVEVGSARYSETMVTFKISLTDSDAGSVSEARFKENAVYFGLAESDFGREFQSGGKQFRLVDIKPRNRKYPLIGEDIRTGKQYKFPLATVKQRFAFQEIQS